MDAIFHTAQRNATRIMSLAREWVAADESDGRVRNALATVNGLVWVGVVLRGTGIG
jgi:hypothetical protein